MMKEFTEKFDSYACVGESIEVETDGFRVVAVLDYDQDSYIDDDDCHSTDQSVTGVDDEQFEKLLSARAAWFADEWWYGGVRLEVWIVGVCLTDHAASLWGIEVNYPDSNNDHLNEVANELLPEALEEGKRILEEFNRRSIRNESVLVQ